MNKSIGGLKKLIAGILLTGCTLLSVNMAIGADFTYGDVNEDKVVNSTDYAMLRDHLNKKLIPVLTRTSFFVIRRYKEFQLTSEYSLKAADVNADGIIDFTDLAVLRAYLLGKSTSLPSNII